MEMRPASQRSRDSLARLTRALAVVGMVAAAGCAAASGPSALSDPATGGPLLTAWLVPADALAGFGGEPAAPWWRRNHHFDLREDYEPIDTGDFIVLEGTPEPPAPTEVAVRATALEVLRIDAELYVAVRVAREAGSGEVTAGLFPLEPSPATAPTATGRAPIGLWVTGAPIANWSNGGTYRGEGVWRTVAPGAVGDDGFSCAGPAADESSPHVYPECLALHLGDDGARHSPVYGFAADGYPVHGPWADLELLARSSWRLRDYDTAGSATGCAEAGRRTCRLADSLDPAGGVVPAPAPGPTTAEVPAGAFFEDYWFDIGLDDGAPHALDAFNGHSHDDLGYHYHVTRIQNGDGSFTDTFPYILGPWFRGELRPGDPHAGGPQLPEGAVTSGSPAAQTADDPAKAPTSPSEPPTRPPEPPALCLPRLGVCD